MSGPLYSGRFWAGVPPWIFIGALAVLLPVFALMTLQNINIQKENSVRLMTEKGAALIRSFEAGTRTGMMGMMGMQRGGEFRLQRLLTETAQQPDIAYLAVTDENGRILAHSDPDRIDGQYDPSLDFSSISDSAAIGWRIVPAPEDGRSFEVFRRFAPAAPPWRDRDGHMPEGYRPGWGRNRWRDPDWRNQPETTPPPPPNSRRCIFVGLDMSAMEAARRADHRHTVIMGALFLLMGFAGILLLFLAANYRAARRSLSRVQAFSDKVVANMPIGLAATDDAGRIVAFNAAAAVILKLNPASVLGHPAEQALPEALWRPPRPLGPDGETMVSIKANPTPPPTTLPLEIHAFPLKDETGRFLGQVLLFKDLTEVRTLRREVEKSRRLAAVGRLAAGVAHEIRNPLSSIKGFATYFKERCQNNPEDLSVADIMISETDRLNRVVSQLLEFARPIALSPADTDLAPFLQNSLRLVEKRAREARVQLALTPPDAPLSGRFDAERIHQVLLNLYINAIEAIEAMPEGGSLTISAAPAGDPNVEIRVSDTGRGIPEADLAQVFDPYFTTKKTGTGLGLAIANNIMAAHGGRIRIESRPGAGATAILTLQRSETKPS